MSNLSQWSTSAGGNTAAPPDGWPEGMARDQVNDTGRENMAGTARWYQDTNASLVTGGIGNAYTLTTNSGFTALVDVSVLVVKFDRAPTGAATIAVDTIPAKSIVKAGGAAIGAADIDAGQTGFLVPNTTNDNFELHRTKKVTPGDLAAQTQGQVIRYGASGNAEAHGPGTAGNVLRGGGAGVDAAFSPDYFGQQLFHARDEKASGTDGGTFTSGAWQTRVLNTEMTNEITGASLAGNQITDLPAGTYFIQARAPWTSGNQGDVRAQLRLRNITDGTTALVGASVERAGSDGDNDRAGGADNALLGRFTLAATKTLELQHRISNTQSTDGFGGAAGFGETEVYAEVLIWKVG